jgi:hypothetical protein
MVVCAMDNEIGLLLEQLINHHNLFQLINQPYDFSRNCIPACIYLSIDHFTVEIASWVIETNKSKYI